MSHIMEEYHIVMYVGVSNWILLRMGSGCEPLAEVSQTVI